MAAKDTNSTIFTVAIVAILGYAAYKYFGRPRSQAQTGTGSVAGGGDYYAPDAYQPDQGNLLQQLLNALKGSSNQGGSKSNPNNALKQAINTARATAPALPAEAQRMC